MPRQKGYKCDARVRKNMSEAAKRRKSFLTGLYGFTQEFIDEQRASGKSWCSDCKSFYEGRGRRCKPCTKKRNSLAYLLAVPADRTKKRSESRRRNWEAATRRDRTQNLKRYKVDHAWYDKAFAEQNGLCALCLRPSHKRLAIDHDHRCCESKRACDKCRRGLLCYRCNVSLERIEANPDWAARALAYLERYSLNVTDAAQLARHPEA